MTTSRWSLGWGLALVTVGVWLLLRNLGLLPAGVGLMPLLLIAAGAALLVGGVSGRRTVLPEAASAATASLPLGGATRARLKFGYGAGTLRVGAGAGAGLLYEGAFAGGVREDSQVRGDVLEVNLRHASGAPRLVGWSRPLDWDLRLATGIPLDIQVNTGASRVRLDLSDLHVRSLEIETGASDVEVTLPSKGSCRVEIEAGAADVRVLVPEGMAASVRTSSALASVNIDPARFPRVNGSHRSPDYDTASDRADIEIEGGLAAFSVH